MNYEPASDELRMQNNCYNMMHFFSKRIVMALWACCSISASYALKFTVDKITYETLTDNTVKVSGFNFNLIDVTIPSTVEYKNVKLCTKSRSQICVIKKFFLFLQRRSLTAQIQLGSV